MLRTTQEGVDYFYVTREQFDADCKEGKFLEHATVHNNCYGTSIASVAQVAQSGRCCILDLDTQGARQIRDAGLRAIFVFIAPPSTEELENRLRGRGTESEEQVQRRLQAALNEMEAYVWMVMIMIVCSVVHVYMFYKVHPITPVPRSPTCLTMSWSMMMWKKRQHSLFVLGIVHWQENWGLKCMRRLVLMWYTTKTHRYVVEMGHVCPHRSHVYTQTSQCTPMHKRRSRQNHQHLQPTASTTRWKISSHPPVTPFHPQTLPNQCIWAPMSNIVIRLQLSLVPPRLQALHCVEHWHWLGCGWWHWQKPENPCKHSNVN